MTHKIRHHSSKFLTAYLLHSCAVAFCLVLASCAGTRSQPAPVIDRTELPSDNSQESTSTSKSGADNPSTSKKPLSGNQYEVVKGDTLYSIGKKLGIPYQKIAENQQHRKQRYSRWASAKLAWRETSQVISLKMLKVA